MVADASYNSDVFVKRIKAIKKTAENLANYLNNVSPEEIVEHKMADIVAGLYPYMRLGVQVKIYLQYLNMDIVLAYLKKKYAKTMSNNKKY